MDRSCDLTPAPHEPPHVHVDRDDLSAKFWLQPLGLARNFGFSPKELGRIHCTFPENTEPAATGQGVVSADFSTPTGERPSRARRGSPR
ncbi:MAG: DUF4160 domain-containing protein [Isosphaeraceae bacterium]